MIYQTCYDTLTWIDDTEFAFISSDITKATVLLKWFDLCFIQSFLFSLRGSGMLLQLLSNSGAINFLLLFNVVVENHAHCTGIPMHKYMLMQASITFSHCF